MKKFLLYVRQYLLIIAGAVSYGIGTTCFIQAAKIATGGVVGVFNVINIIRPVPVGLCVLIVNIPLIIVSFFKFKPRFAINSMIGIILTSVAIDTIELFVSKYLPFTNDMLLSALAGALFNGAGTGLIMRNGSSTGGSDIITKLIHRKLPHLKGGVIGAFLGLVVCIYALLSSRVLRQFRLCQLVGLLQARGSHREQNRRVNLNANARIAGVHPVQVCNEV